ncbi:MAG: hypothetical protein GWO24_10635 [Akkermansiaceae bacterium]|nr:hypothetical protein [Akkermansiaceae bacterium]
MMRPPRTLLAIATLVIAAPVADAADIRIKVSNRVLGNKRDGDTRSSQRQLRIEIDNRDRTAYEGVTMEWTIIARDIRNRKLSIAGSGSKEIDIPANEEIEVKSGPYSLSRTEGKIERINQNRNRPDLPQYKVDRDTGTRYAGYIVVLRKDGEVIAESATAGMKRRVQGLTGK